MGQYRNSAIFLSIIIFTFCARASFSFSQDSSVVSEVIVDPKCGECSVPAVDGLQGLLFTGSAGISVEDSFFPFLPQDVLTYVNLSSETLQNPLAQLLKENFAAIEAGQFDQAALGFLSIKKSLSRQTHPLEVELTRLGLAVAEFDSKKSAVARLKKLAGQKTYPELARLSAYVLARSLEKRSRAEQAKDWYNQVIKSGQPGDVLVESSAKRKLKN